MSTATKPGKKKASESIKIQPLGDRVVVDREQSEERTAGGIVLPDTAKDKPRVAPSLRWATGDFYDGKRSELKSKSAIRCCSRRTARGDPARRTRAVADA